jgi:hypothetical protein
MQALSQLSYTPIEPYSITARRSSFIYYTQYFHTAYKLLAEWTGLEPATPGVTGRYSNQLNYHSR